jgi:hypothetical protein
MDWKCAQFRVSLGPTQIACVYLIDPDTLAIEFTDPTLMATRAFLNIRLDGESVPAGVGGIAAIGLIAWDSSNGEAPIGDNCPGPIRDCDFDWIARWSGPAPAGTTVGTLLGPNIFDNTHLSRARRRLPTGTGLLVAFETIEIPASFAADIRCLIKE